MLRGKAHFTLYSHIVGHVLQNIKECLKREV